ncbi:MAG: dihydroorotase [Desulfobacterales bacterium]|nr:dihydroorotase [Desulfobacterales bacterium]
MRIVIKGGRVVDPDRLDGIRDVFIEDDQIAAVIGQEEDAGRPFGENDADRVIAAQDCIVSPGLVDMHVHLREPGEEYKETIETGIRAAAAGGFTSICCMPNTKPVNDSKEVTTYIISRAKSFRSVRVFPVAAVSMGLEGEALSEYGALKAAGAVAVSDDGRPVANSQLMRRALEYSQSIGFPVISHTEELTLSNGVMNEGPVATRLGLSGIPNAAESVMVMRDIALAELTGSPVHIAHVSTSESVREIRAAKQRGVAVTAETAPHFFTLTDQSVVEYNTHAKMYPPLRSEKDRRTVCEALADGTIDAIATDHAPHSELEKQVPFDEAANGVIGLETSVSLGLRIVEEGWLTLWQWIEKMSINPARILGLPTGIRVGGRADLTVIDPSQAYTYRAAEGLSKARNTPFEGWELKGRTRCTIVDGRIIHEI